MTSLRVKRTMSAAAAISIVFATVVSAPAFADPEAPDNASDALQAYMDLKSTAAELNESHLKAQDDLAAAEADLSEATSRLEEAGEAEAAALADEATFREVVDQFAGASYMGGQSNSMSAMLSGGSTHDVLERSAALDLLAAEKNEAMSKLQDAVDRAERAQQVAAEAEQQAGTARDEAAQHEADIDERKRALDTQVEKAEQAYRELSGQDRSLYQSTLGEQEIPPSEIKAPGAAAQTAVDAAMSQRGKPYSYGASGPNAYDCSGLTSWSYNQAGISLPRSSSQQATVGTPVSRDQLQPGDLVFFYQPISHVGIYIGNGQMVHAPQSGDVVKVASIFNGYNTARRVA